MPIVVNTHYPDATPVMKVGCYLYLTDTADTDKLLMCIEVLGGAQRYREGESYVLSVCFNE
jgi:hypothetical protein